MEMADHIFYRTFNVGNFTISDKIDDKIAGVEVKNLLNKSRVPESRAAKHNPKNNQNGNAMTSNEGSQLCPQLNSLGTSVNISTDAMAGRLALKDDKDMKVSFVKQKPLSGGNHVADLSVEIKETAVPAVIKEQVSSHEEMLPRPTADSCNDVIKTSSTSISKVEDKKLKSSNDLGVLDDRPSKKARLDSP
ncbi:Anti-silencing 1-like, partial [Thalictrum thalictroides]